MSERNDIRIDVVGNADSFEASTRGAASELDAVKRQILDMAAKAQGATGATRSLGVEQERLAAAARASRDALEREAAAKRASREAAEGAARATTDLGGAMGGATTRNIQNVAYQLQDFAVQVNGGVDATRALSQQLPQMLVGMGATGAVIGLVAALLPNFVAAFSDAGKGAKTLTEALGDLNRAVGETGQATKTFDMDGLYEEFNKANAATRAAIVEQVRFQQEFIRTSRLVAEKKLGETAGGLTSYSFMDKLAGSFGKGQSGRLADQLGISPEVAKDLAPMLTGLKNGTEDASLVFQRFGTVLLSGKPKAVELATSLNDLAKSERDAAAASTALSDAQQKMARGHVTTKKEAAAATKGSRDQVSDFELLVTALNKKIAVETLDLQTTEKLSTAEREFAGYQADLTAGRIKLTAAERDMAAAFWQTYLARAKANAEEKVFQEALARQDLANVKANQTMLDRIAAAERETELYGLTAAQVSVVEQARLADAIAIAQSNGVSEAQLAVMRQELELRGRLSEALIRKEGKQYDAENAKKSVGELDEFTKSAARNMQSAMADFFFEPFDKGLQGLGDRFAKTLQRMIADAAAAQLGRLLFGDMAGGKATGSSGWIGQAASWASSFDWSSVLTAVGFHEGGKVQPGGESFRRAVPAGAFANARRFHGGGFAGDEVPAILKKGEQVLTPEQQMQRQMGMTINQTIYAGQGTDKAEVRRSAAAGARTALGIMSGAQRYA